MQISRRTFLLSSLGASLALTSAGAAYAVIADTTDALEYVELTVPVPKLPPVFEGYRIGFLTDIHLGPFVLTETVATALQMLNAQKPNLVIYGGDYGWLPERNLLYPPRNPDFAGMPRLERNRAVYTRLGLLSQSVAAPDGTVGVLGNHDRWVEPATCLEVLTRYGIKMLINQEHRIVRGDATLSVYGVDDYWTGVPRSPPAPVRSADVRILVAHNPDYAAVNLKNGADWWHLALCGHTHGGQICAPLVGPLVDNIDHREYAVGAVHNANGQLVYTSRGIGVVEIPRRINCRPEVTLLRLVRA